MSGTTNFQQFNPNQINQETDDQFTGDSLRTTGAPFNGLLSSILFNKLMYQLTTGMVGLMQSLANKGYSTSDANLGNLISVLGNIMTLADMTPYAPLNNPKLTGNPIAPTPGAGDNSSSIATTAFVDNAIAALASQGWVNSQVANLQSWVSGNFDTISNVNSAVNNLRNLIQSGLSYSPSGPAGYIQLPAFLGGIMIEWGSIGGTSNSNQWVSFIPSFPNSCFMVNTCIAGLSDSYYTAFTLQSNLSPGGFDIYFKSNGNISVGSNYIAIGN